MTERTQDEQDDRIDTVAHYERLEPVYRELGSISYDGEWYQTSWLNGHASWYVTDTVSPTHSAVQEGFPYRARAAICPDDVKISDIDRDVYMTNTYFRVDDLEEVYYKVEGGEKVYRSEGVNAKSHALANYEDIRAFSFVADIDIADEYKKRPLPDSQQEVIEERLQNWIRVFEALTGGRTYALDSGGGVYLLTPPLALAPIQREFDEAEAGFIYQKLCRRMNTVLEVIDKAIIEQDDAPPELFSVDCVNNKNRQFKTIGALHKSLNVVTHPIETDNPRFDALKPEDVDEPMVDTWFEWASDFTSQEHEDAIESIVEYLFQNKFVRREDVPLEPVEGDDWVTVLETWIGTIQERQEQYESVEYDDDWENVGVTNDWEELQRAVMQAGEYIDKEQLARELAREWGTRVDDDGTVSFDPCWRPCDSGTGAFYDPNEDNIVDRDGQTPISAIEGVAFLNGYTEEINELPSGREFFLAIDRLVERGAKIPIYLDDSEQIPHSRIADAAVGLGIIEEDEVVEKTDENGRSYRDIADNGAWNETLERLEDKGIEHRHMPHNPDIGGTPSTQSLIDEVDTEWAEEHLFDPEEAEGDLAVQIEMGTVAPAWMQDIVSIEYPYYELADTEFELHLVPTMHGRLLFSLVETETHAIVVMEPKSFEDIETSAQRQQIAAGMLSDTVLEDDSAKLELVKSRLRGALADAFNDKVSGKMPAQSAAPTLSRFLVTQTDEVVRTRNDLDGSTLEVWFKPDPRTPSEGGAKIELEMDVLNKEQGKVILSAYSNAFGERMKADDDLNLSILIEYWDEVKKREKKVATEQQTYVDNFVSLFDDGFNVIDYQDIETLTDWGGAHNPTAAYIETYVEDEDAFVVAGQFINEHYITENGITFDIETLLLEEGILVDKPHRARQPLASVLKDAGRVNRPSVWTLNPDAVRLQPPKDESDEINDDGRTSAPMSA
ncbi:hypothetical protein ACLI4Y_13155 [Natrialbaceae archaeon A-CW3]